MGWHYNDLTAATGAPLAFTLPRGYVFDAQGTQHVFYGGFVEGQGSDGRIHELWWDSNGWHHNDLTAATGAPLRDNQDPTSYVFNAQGTQHVVYLGAGAGGQGTDGHVHELWWDSNGWHLNDLTAAAGAPLTSGPQVAYAFEAQFTQHVFFNAADGQGLDGHIIELWWDNNGWHHNDLTAAIGAPLSFGPETGYVFFAQGTQHLFYQRIFPSGGTDNHIHELWWDNNGWHDNDLTAATGILGLHLGFMTSYVFAAQGTQHVFFLAGIGQGLDGHIIELWWDSNGWHHNDLTATTGAPLAGSAPTGYMFDAQGTQHVVYQGGGIQSGDGHIHELFWDCNGWHHNDLTAATGAPLVSGAGGPVGADDLPTGYGFVAQGTQHVNYTAADGHIIELYWVPE